MFSEEETAEVVVFRCRLLKEAGWDPGCLCSWGAQVWAREKDDFILNCKSLSDSVWLASFYWWLAHEEIHCLHLFYYLWDWFPGGCSPTSTEVSGKTAIDLIEDGSESIEDGSESMGVLHGKMDRCSFFLPSSNPEFFCLLCRADLWYVPMAFSLWAGFSIESFDLAPLAPVYDSFFVGALLICQFLFPLFFFGSFLNYYHYLFNL